MCALGARSTRARALDRVGSGPSRIKGIAEKLQMHERMG